MQVLCDSAAPSPAEHQPLENQNPGVEKTGRTFRSPSDLGRADWKTIFIQTAKSLISGPTTLVAAGCAFYTTLSLFPAISSLISIYGLAFDVQTVTPQLEVLRSLLPPSAYSLIYDRIQTLVAEPHSSLTFNLVISLSVALWSTSAATRSILAALNIAYNTKESRSFIVFQITALSMTLSAVLGAALTLALMVALPLFLNLPAWLHIPTPPGSLEFAARWSGPLIMFTFQILATSVLYRFGPDRHHPALWRWVLPGALFATLTWIISASGFSYYVAHIASYNATYGPLGAVIAIMMWFFVSAWVILMGAELNAEMESYARGERRKPVHL
ncbi:YihY/virulence factor BrkB family protein [Acetobacter tropicalis]|uniref:YihY/virulence factor BrkB family protein n=1 Tax=Acetobacter tropicalis TaxID=104102 RepID=UPI003974E743